MDEKTYRTYAPMLYGMILRFTDDTGKANEILENSFAEFYRLLPQFPSSNCRLFTWMMRIMLKECIKELELSPDLLKLRMIPCLTLKPSTLMQLNMAAKKGTNPDDKL